MTRSSTDTDYAERLLRTQLYIETHLDEELSVETLAEVANFSKHHFQRVFRGLTGESVMAHVRRLRIERAAMRLRLGARSITEIALTCGYASHEAFTRAFCERFGMPPSEYRRTLEAAPEREQALRVEHLPARETIYVRHVGPYGQVGAAFARLGEFAGPRGLMGPQAEFLGLSWDDPSITEGGKIRYDASLVVASALAPSGELGARRLPAGRWALATHRGPYSTLEQTYVPLLSQWLPRRRLEPADFPPVERYLSPPTATPEDTLTEIQIFLAGQEDSP